MAYNMEKLWIKKTAFALIAIGMVFQGVGKSPRYPFVALYIDNAVDKRKTGFYMGEMLVLVNMSLVLRKPVFGVSDQVRHKPGCTATEDG